MATMVATDINDLNDGEKELYSALERNLPPNYFVYKRREVDGIEFDFCVMAAHFGVVVIEVKGWSEDLPLRVEKGETVIVTHDGREVAENPRKQVRGYQFALLNKIRDLMGAAPLVIGMVCYPYLSRDYYLSKGLNLISEETITLFREDLADGECFKIKLQAARTRRVNFYRSDFSEEQLFQIRSMFEPHPIIGTGKEITESGVRSDDQIDLGTYSILQYIAPQESSFQAISESLIDHYCCGVKIIVFVAESEQYLYIHELLKERLRQKKIKVVKNDLQPLRADEEPIGSGSVQFFNCFNFQLISLCDTEQCWGMNSFQVINGKVDMTGQLHDLLNEFHRVCSFNYEQFQIEHALPHTNILVKAGAGTGKTHSMVSRVAYLRYACGFSPDSLSQAIAMMTFTNEAADNMKGRLKKCFENYYLLRGLAADLRYIEAVDRMQIGTIHSYAQQVVKQAGALAGFGVDLAVTNSRYDRKGFFEKVLDDYLKNVDTNQLDRPVYEIKGLLLRIVDQLYNKSVDVSTLTCDQLGHNSSPNGDLLHKIITQVVPAAEAQYKKTRYSNNSLHLGETMIAVNKVVELNAVGLCDSGVQYMFVDEFQDTDDTQIDTLLKLQQCMNFKLFVVGDIKQCIYRFRGAEVKAFDRLEISQHSSQWQEYSMTKNYRSDRKLLEAFEPTFYSMGTSGVLTYGPEDKLFSDIVINAGISRDEYYRCREFDRQNDDSRFQVLFEEVERAKQQIKTLIERGVKLSSAEQTVAILVRENWQAEKIKEKASSSGHGFVYTFTGGDLYKTEAAIDLYRLVLAMLHPYEPKYLAGLALSSYFSEKIDAGAMWQMRQDKKKQVEAITTCLDGYISARTGGAMTWRGILRILRTEPLLRSLKTIIDICQPWTNASVSPEEQKRYMMNLEYVLELIIHRRSINYLSLSTLAQHLFISIVTQQEAEQRIPEPDVGGPMVVSLTVHKSKGLEYGYVIMPFTDFNTERQKVNGTDVTYVNGKVGYSIPSKDKRVGFLRNSCYDVTNEKLERQREEARILYVAMTRAIRSFTWLQPDQIKPGPNWAMLLKEGI